ncbi:MAG: hypothetical protein A2Y80_01920 [Deltaproteobacteria bacterium RBG_13_58_19]|nr:MAG: hypothetical protein A2Y80_01920 [Deltaproteobacteria bacterium RBG_13_58_19]
MAIGIILTGFGIFLSVLSQYIELKYLARITEIIGLLLIGAGPTIIIEYYIKKRTHEIIEKLKAEIREQSDDIVIKKEQLKDIYESGVVRIFRSRKENDDKIRLAIEAAAKETKGAIFLMGVAFPSLFDINDYKTPEWRDKLEDPNILIRVLLLDPKSEAAERRAEIEKGNQTITDIKSTLENKLPSYVKIRFDKIDPNKINNVRNKLILDRIKYDELSDDERSLLRKYINIEVKIYWHDPIIFIMGFADSLFTEQYHFGRPKKVPDGSCIGKFVPVIQYNKSSKAYDFYKCHFDWVWENYSKCYIDELLSKSLVNI